MPSVVERLAPTTQTRQRAEHRGEGRIKRRGQLLDLVHGLALQRVEQALLGLATQCGRLCQAAIDAYMTEVHVHVGHIGQFEHLQHQADDLEIAGRRRITVQFCTELNGAARGGKRLRLGMQHAAGIAQPARPFTTQGMRIDAGHCGVISARSPI